MAMNIEQDDHYIRFDAADHIDPCFYRRLDICMDIRSTAPALPNSVHRITNEMEDGKSSSCLFPRFHCNDRTKHRNPCWIRRHGQVKQKSKGNRARYL